MTRKDALILGLVTILGSAFMFCYVSGFNKAVILWTVAVTVVVLGLFFFMANKKGLFSNPNKPKDL